MPDIGLLGKIYRRSIRTSFFLVLFLVFVGGVVRSTGSGMGCPDWPKCFGLWIPPIHISEVPEKYWPNPRLPVDMQIQFNPVKTWTEYLNRLLGVFVGFVIGIQWLVSVFITLRSLVARFSFLNLFIKPFWVLHGLVVVASFLVYYYTERWFPALAVVAVLVALYFLFHLVFVFVVDFPVRTYAPFFSLVTLILVGFQGWLGSQVVATHLKPVVISLHLLVALIIALTHLLSLFHARVRHHTGLPFAIRPVGRWLVPLTSGFLLLQFFLGTEVRAQVDILFQIYNFEFRELYFPLLNWVFVVHRSSSLLVFGLMLAQIWFLGKVLPVRYLYMTGLPVLITLFLIFSGMVLAYFDFPAFMQPFHLLFGLSIVAAQFWLHLHHRSVLAQRNAGA
jgi:cytochrome c oxidase assembly protein subunit 15